MTDLKPCPFCGGAAELRDDNGNEYPYTVECVECGATTSQHRHADTPYGAIEAWNTRADVAQDAVPMTEENMQEHGWVRERTCHWELEHRGTLYDKWRCSKCGYLFVEPLCDRGYTDLEPNYCPNCGARVVEVSE